MAVTGDVTQIDLPRGVRLGPGRGLARPAGGRGPRLRAVHLGGRGAPYAGRADHQRLRGRRPADAMTRSGRDALRRSALGGAGDSAALAERGGAGRAARARRRARGLRDQPARRRRRRIAELNATFRGKAGATNVLSWPSADGPAAPGEPRFLGDLALAYETCAAEAEAAGITPADHVTHLVVARRPAPSRPRPRGRRGGRGDGGAGTKSTCHPRRADPYSR